MPRTTLGSIRGRCCRILFGENPESVCLAEQFTTCLSKCPIDIRKVLAGHVVLVGGAASIASLEALFSARVRRKATQFPWLASTRTKPMAFSPLWATWVGASLCACVPDFHTNFVPLRVSPRRRDADSMQLRATSLQLTRKDSKKSNQQCQDGAATVFTENALHARSHEYTQVLIRELGAQIEVSSEAMDSVFSRAAELAETITDWTLASYPQTRSSNSTMKHSLRSKLPSSTALT